MNGILLIDKPEGLLCSHLLNRLKRDAGLNKVGHAGTLDPLASGLLLVGVGRGTRILGYLTVLDKEYLCQAQMGLTTDTYDRTGRVLKTFQGPFPGEETVLRALADRLGVTEQVPPAFSALKIGGLRAHAMAREGRPVSLAARRIRIQTLDLTEWDSENHRFSCRILCSKGTYIRSLIHDLGEALGCGAAVCGLRRVGIGQFRVEDALSGDLLHDREKIRERLMPLAGALYFMDAVAVDVEDGLRLQKGVPCVLRRAPEGALPGKIQKAVTSKGGVLGLVQGIEHPDGTRYRIVRMIEGNEHEDSPEP